jgi:hypothetical protein
MREYGSSIIVYSAQTKDVCAAQAVWDREGRLYREENTPAQEATTWRADGSSKRAPKDKQRPQLGRDLAELRALRKLVSRLERIIGPDAFDAPKELPPVVVTIEYDTTKFQETLAKLQASMSGIDAAMLRSQEVTGVSPSEEPTIDPEGTKAEEIARWRYGATLGLAAEYGLPGDAPWEQLSVAKRSLMVKTTAMMIARFFPEYIAEPAVADTPKVPASTFHYDPESATLRLSATDKSLLGWLKLWLQQIPSSKVWREMIESVKGTVSEP